jgi:hypothetical protein
MLRALAVSFAVLAASSAAFAQTATEPNEGSRIIYDSSTGTFSFAWFSHPQRTYFVQMTNDLMGSWEYIPVIEPGQNTVAEWGFSSNANQVFARLVVSDIFTLNAWDDDFDADGVSNYAELLLGTDPFVAETGFDPNADDDSDGVINGEDAAPGDPAIGQLSVTITSPANNATLD